MTSYQTAYETLHGFIKLSTGIDDTMIRPFHQNAPLKVPLDRVTSIVFINFTSFKTLGHSALQYANQIGTVTDDNGTTEDESDDTEIDLVDLVETVKSDVILTASINVYGTNADDTAQKIINGFSSSAAISLLSKGGLGYLQHGQVLNISAIQNGSFENRRQFDAEFHAEMTTSAVVNAVTSAQINWEFHGSQITTGQIEVNNE